MLDKLKMRKDEEYEMQLFGFTSRAVCATLDRLVDETIQICCNKLSESLNRTHNLETNDSLKLRIDAKSLVKAYSSHSHIHKRAMKKCVKKVIAVPLNILAREDQCQAITYSRGAPETEKHLRDLQSRARKATILQAALKDELLSIDKIEPQSGLVEIVSNVIEKCSVKLDVNTEMIKCVSSHREFEDLVENGSANSETANPYTNDIDNVATNELDVDTL